MKVEEVLVFAEEPSKGDMVSLRDGSAGTMVAFFLRGIFVDD